MRKIITGQLAAAKALESAAHTIFEITDPDGNWRDVSQAIDDQDWLNSGSLEEGADGNSQRLNVRLTRDVAGFQIASNPEFVGGSLAGYSIYDNSATGLVSITAEVDSDAPSGWRMRVTSAAGAQPSPGIGGFTRAFLEDGGTYAVNRYHKGDRLLYKILAWIPVGATINFGSNAYGNEGYFRWLTPVDGYGQWHEYMMEQIIGRTGSFAATGYFYILPGTVTRPFSWYVRRFLAINTSTTLMTSLAPLRTDSANNRNQAGNYAPLVDINRKWRLKLAILPKGVTPSRARSNGIVWSRDLTSPHWNVPSGASGGALFNAVGVDGLPNTATTLSDTDAAAIQQAYTPPIAIPADGNFNYFQYAVRKDAVASPLVSLFADLVLAASHMYRRLDLNTSTGAYSVVSSAPAPPSFNERVTLSDDGQWWIVEMLVQNDTTRTVAQPTIYIAGPTATDQRSVVIGHAGFKGNYNVGNPGQFAAKPEIFVLTEGAAVTNQDDYREVGQGWYDKLSVKDSPAVIEITGRDLGAILLDGYIRQKRSYGSGAGVDALTVIQQIINDNALDNGYLPSTSGGITAYTEEAGGLTGFLINTFEVQPGPEMQAINQVAQKAEGRVFRYRYNSADVMQPWLWKPNRSQATEDVVLGPDHYTAIPQNDLDKGPTRTVVEIKFFDVASGTIHTIQSPLNTGTVSAVAGAATFSTSQAGVIQVGSRITVQGVGVFTVLTFNGTTGATLSGNPTFAASSWGTSQALTNYNVRYLGIDVSSSGVTNSDAKAQLYADAIRSDTENPALEQTIEIFGGWYLQLGDYIKLLANATHYDADQLGGVVSIAHRFNAGAWKSTVGLKGKPLGRYATWLNQGTTDLSDGPTAPVIEPPTINVTRSSITAPTDTQETVTISGALGTGGASYQWRYRIITEKLTPPAWGAFSPTPALPQELAVTRAAKWKKTVEAQAMDAAGNIVTASREIQSQTDFLTDTGDPKRGKPYDDGNYNVPATTSDGLVVHAMAQESGLKLVNRLLAKPLGSSPDNADSVGGGLVNRIPLVGGTDSGGNLNLAGTAWVNKNQDNLPDGSTYGQLRQTLRTQAGRRAPSQGQNLLFNPGFEDDMAFWVNPSGSASIITDAVKAHSGNKYLQLAQPSVASDIWIRQADDAGGHKFFETVAGDVVEVGAWVFIEAGNAAAVFQIEGRDRNQAFTSLVATSTPSAGSWQFVKAERTTAAGEKYVTITFEVFGGTVATTVRVDDLYYKILRPTNDVLGGSLRSGVNESGGKAINRLYAKSLSSSPDNADSVGTGLVNKSVALTVIDSGNNFSVKGSGSPSVSALKGLGTGGSISISGTDQAGLITLITGTASAGSGGAWIRVTFGNTKAVAPAVVVQCDGSSGQLVKAYPMGANTTRFDIYIDDVPLDSRTIYFNYLAFRLD